MNLRVTGALLCASLFVCVPVQGAAVHRPPADDFGAMTGDLWEKPKFVEGRPVLARAGCGDGD